MSQPSVQRDRKQHLQVQEERAGRVEWVEKECQGFGDVEMLRCLLEVSSVDRILSSGERLRLREAEMV